MREFRDPVHGFIRLEDHEAKLVDSEPFQRLRRISQLGLTSYVYHGAEHSRFGHSLGCMHLASQAFDGVTEKHRSDLGWSENDVAAKRRLVRVAALLHDVGHGPFSHAGEKGLFVQPRKHDHYSVALVTSSPLADIIEDCAEGTGVRSSDVADLLDKSALIPHQFLRELISGELGADRMDYLARDSLFCGVKYGVFDAPRLIDCLILKEEKGGGFVLALDGGGLHAAEGLLLARYFMFTQVYFHRVRRAYDLHLTDLISHIMLQQYGTAAYPEDLAEYVKWDDETIRAAAQELADETAANAAWRILHRQHYAWVYDTGPHPQGESILHFPDLLEAARRRFPDRAFRQDAATDHPERYREMDIWVRKNVPEEWVLFARESAAAAGLKEVVQMRLYSDVRGNESLRQDMARFCQEFLRS
jgi:hypothetical protein